MRGRPLAHTFPPFLRLDRNRRRSQLLTFSFSPRRRSRRGSWLSLSGYFSLARSFVRRRVVLSPLLSALVCLPDGVGIRGIFDRFFFFFDPMTDPPSASDFQLRQSQPSSEQLINNLLD